MKENILKKIIRKTGRKPIECKCEECKKQCRTPCLGTPYDIKNLIDAGYKDYLMATEWAVGLVLGRLNYTIPMVQAIQKDDGWCIFYENGLCKLHNLNLKPTEGRLSHHTLRAENYVFSKGIAYNVAKEWLIYENRDVIEEIFTLYSVEELKL